MKRLTLNTFRELTVPCPRTEAKLTHCGNELYIALDYSGAFGMGEKYNALNQKGRTVVNRVEEKFCFQGDKSYCPAPFFWTDTGFGFFADCCETVTFAFGQDGISVQMPENAQFVVFTGSPKEIIGSYMSLFGKAALPPDWAFGTWISANRWSSQKDAEKQIKKLRDYGFPASVMVLEAWSDEATFYIFNGASYKPTADGQALKYEDFDFSASRWPDPKGMIDKIHAAGLHLLLWQVPVYKKQSADEVLNRQNELDRADAIRRGLCVKNGDGSEYTIPDGHWFSGSMLPDFTNPDTIKSWFAKRAYLLDIGVDGFKTDGGEFIYSDEAAFHDGSSGKAGVNRYARDYIEAYSRFVGNQRCIFSRAGFSGQHTVPILWAGDQQSQNSELKSALTAGLSAAATGTVFWGFDIAGFAGPLPTLDLYRRATQLACFCPIMQWHSEPDGGQFRELMPGGEGNNERSPWNMAAAYNSPEFIDEMRYWHVLRSKLRSYLAYTARLCAQENMPMLRPLCINWPADKAAVDADDEFMLGNALLIAPLLEENADCRKLYLPEGRWTNFFDKKEYSGGRYITAGGDGKPPVFIAADCCAEELELLRDI